MPADEHKMRSQVLQLLQAAEDIFLHINVHFYN
jgi:hypothetical protein